MSVANRLAEMIQLYEQLATDSLVPDGVNEVAGQAAGLAKEMLACEERIQELRVELELTSNNMRELLHNGQ